MSRSCPRRDPTERCGETDERGIVDRLSVDDGVDLEPGRLDLQLEGAGAVTYLLDANVVSELRKPRAQADPGVHVWARAQRTSDL